ncbi:MAG TPA: hypothetical protein VHA52_03260 [Candidatus Babeliaceae bacterium]|nr:hypothetical protein [Candidatus Babeliaceae bacterium]
MRFVSLILLTVTVNLMAMDSNIVSLNKTAEFEVKYANYKILLGEYLEGLKYCKWVVEKSDTNTSFQAGAWALLGELYFLGQGGVTQDLVAARMYCEKASKQNFHLPAKGLALVTLGQLELKNNPKLAKKKWKKALDKVDVNEVGIKAAAYYLLGNYYATKAETAGQSLDKAKFSYYQVLGLGISQPPFMAWGEFANTALRKLDGLETDEIADKVKKLPAIGYVNS